MRPHKRDPGTVYLTVIINTEMTVAGTAEQCNSSQSRHTIQRFIQSLPHARHFDGCLYTAARYPLSPVRQNVFQKDQKHNRHRFSGLLLCAPLPDRKRSRDRRPQHGRASPQADQNPNPITSIDSPSSRRTFRIAANEKLEICANAASA